MYRVRPDLRTIVEDVSAGMPSCRALHGATLTSRMVDTNAKKPQQ